MINFRYHVVSLTAVLLALAAGTVLGAGFLTPEESDDQTTTAVADQGLTSFENGYAAVTSPALLRGRLARQSVVVLTTPGARSGDVRGVTAALESAGATIVGRVDLTARLLDPANRQFADGVAEQAGADSDAVASAAAGFPRVGAALGRALLTTQGTAIDEAATQLTAAFVEGDLATVATQPTARATVAVIITGPRTSGSSQQGASLAGISAGLDQLGRGVVVAGPSSSSLDGGLVAGVRNDDVASQVSTVDVTDTAAGRIVVALAVAREVADQAGAWGTSRSSDGAIPSAG